MLSNSEKTNKNALQISRLSNMLVLSFLIPVCLTIVLLIEDFKFDNTLPANYADDYASRVVDIYCAVEKSSCLDVDNRRMMREALSSSFLLGMKQVADDTTWLSFERSVYVDSFEDGLTKGHEHLIKGLGDKGDAMKAVLMSQKHDNLVNMIRVALNRKVIFSSVSYTSLSFLAVMWVLFVLVMSSVSAKLKRFKQQES